MMRTCIARDRRGAIAAVVALLMPIIIGSIGLMTDTIELALIRRAMQRQADSGALAGAFAQAQGKAVVATVTGDLTKNANFALTVAPIIENAPTAGAYAGSTNAVRVILATDVRLPFSQIFATATRVSAAATAAVVSVGEYCAVALEPTSATGITMTGSATVDLSCGMVTNSTGANGVSAAGSSWVKASPIAAVGGLQSSGNYVQPTVLQPYAVQQADPFARLPTPVLNGPILGKVSTSPNQTTNLTPGNYSGMDLKGTVTFSPGVYYIVGGSFQLGSQANVSGNGVTIILTSATAATSPSTIATVDINAGATTHLSAPSTGVYAGVMIYQDRRALDGPTNKVNGNSSTTLSGAIYMPSQQVEFTGNTGLTIDCIQLVARRLVFSGNSSVRNVCPAGSGAHAFTRTQVRLVG